MKAVIYSLISILLTSAVVLICLPVKTASADCSASGTTVIYVNGIFTNKREADQDLSRLESKYIDRISNKDVKFISGYNATHGEGIGDLFKCILQAYLGPGLDYDLANILNQVHADLKTQKILLVGHSQGTFYTNAAYNYLTGHGVPAESIAVYNIATPADKVEGGGNYLTSSTDKVINQVRDWVAKGYAKMPLASNIDIKLSESEDKNINGGHSLSGVYLAEASDRIISEINEEISKLKAAQSTGKECFTAPGTGLAYRFEGLGIGVLDGGMAVVGFVQNAAASAVKYVWNAGSALAANFASLFGQNSGASLTSAPVLTAPDVPQVNLAIEPFIGTGGPTEGAGPELLSLSLQDQLDNIQEQLDLIQQQINVLLGQQNTGMQGPADDDGGEDSDEQNSEPEEAISASETATAGSGGREYVNYPPILISEVQAAGVSDEKEEFIELYNPNDILVSLTSWYLQKKTSAATSWSSFATKTLFEGKTIAAKGYFVIARTGYYSGLADIFTDSSVTDDNSFALKNPNGEISDKLGFGTGAADPEVMPAPGPAAGQSVGRKVLIDGSEEETNNNSNDFELQNLTPKAQNTTYAAQSENPSESSPETPPEPVKKILINEVQTDSLEGAGGADDDWVELYNPNDTDVSLAGWSVQKFSSDEPCSLEKGYYKKNFSDEAVIGAKSYYLLVGTQAGADLLDLADMTVGWSLSDDNTVYLVSNTDKIESEQDQNIVDKVGYGQACFAETSPAENPPETKSIERKIIGQDTDNNSADFRISDNPTPKSSFMQAFIEDATNYNDNLGSTNGTPYYQLTLQWRSPSPDMDYFTLQYRINGQDWKTWIAQTTQTSEDFVAYYNLIPDQNIYTFRVKAKDLSGNESEWSEADVDLSAPVMITEAGLFGTTADPADQWIELYNKTDYDIDLAGWNIKANNGQAIIALEGAIPAKSYFLLERKDDDTIPDIPAGQIFTASLPAEGFMLYDQNQRFIDQIYRSPAWTSGEFFNNENYYSVERVSTHALGAQYPASNWLINDGVTINGYDRQGKPVYGTPGQKNSRDDIYTVLPPFFGCDMQMPPDLNPYLSLGTQVPDGVILTIDPGVIIKFAGMDPGFYVAGTMKAVGEDKNKIIFTSYADDEYGGDTDLDGSQSPPGPGNWYGLKFLPTSKNSELSNIVIQYAGAFQGAAPPSWGNAVWVEHSDILLKDSILRQNKNIAVNLVDSESVIDNVKFLETSGSSNKAVFVQAGSPTIRNSYFYENESGIWVQRWYDDSANEFAATPAIENNIFEQNYYAVFVSENCFPVLSQNQSTGDDLNGVMLSGPLRQDWQLKPDTMPYIFSGNFDIPEGKTLIADPGVIFDFKSDISLTVNGTLKALGEPANPVIFRPYFYDQSWIQPGFWRGIHFTKTSLGSVLNNAEISYAATGVDIEGSSPEVGNSTFINNKTHIKVSDWVDPGTGEVVPAAPNLHDNIFLP